MQIDKQQITDMLASRGEEGKVSQAESDLPDPVDTDRDAGILSSLGIDPSDLIGTPGGGQLPGGLGG